MLLRRGYVGVECVENGAEAVEITAARQFDIILMVPPFDQCLASI
jgi:CheY-like chemotaxis protein